MSTHFEVHQIGSVGDDFGQLTVSYVPEHASVTVIASVPGDRRRTDIVIRSVSSRRLREIVDELERVEDRVKRQRIAKESSVLVPGGRSFMVMGHDLLVPDDVIQRARQLVTSGRDQALPKEIQSSFPMLSAAAATELTHLIYVHIRPRE